MLDPKIDRKIESTLVLARVIETHSDCLAQVEGFQFTKLDQLHSKVHMPCPTSHRVLADSNASADRHDALFVF